MLRIPHAENVARRKLGPLPDEWAVASWEIIAKNNILFRGGIARPRKTGKNKGVLTWDKITDEAVVTKEEIEEEQKRFEKETGNCHLCGGDGQEWVGWSSNEGNRFRICTRCNGSGKR